MLPITSHVAGLAGIALVALSIAVSISRGRAGVSLGPGDDPSLTRLIRAHGNFTEHVPLALILLGLSEYRGASTAVLSVAAVAMIAGRIIHAFGMLHGSTRLRAAGMVATHASIIVSSSTLMF